MCRDVHRTRHPEREVVGQETRCRDFKTAGGSIWLDRHANHHPASRDADPRPSIADLDPVRPRIPGDNGLESILLKPDVPAARLAKIDRKDTAGGALADQKGSAIRMHRASVHEKRVRKFAPLSDRAVPLHSVDISGPLAQRPGGYPKHTAGIKRKSHGRCWHLRKWGRRACRRIVAIDAIVRIDGDEYCTLSVDREVLQESARPPRRDCSQDRGKLSPIVIRIIVFSELCGYGLVCMGCHDRVPFCHVIAASWEIRSISIVDSDLRSAAINE